MLTYIHTFPVSGSSIFPLKVYTFFGHVKFRSFPAFFCSDQIPLISCIFYSDQNPLISCIFSRSNSAKSLHFLFRLNSARFLNYFLSIPLIPSNSAHSAHLLRFLCVLSDVLYIIIMLLRNLYVYG